MPHAATRPLVDLGRMVPSLRETCQEYRTDHRARLVDLIERGEGGISVAGLHARVLDGLLGALFCAAEAAVRSQGRAPAGRVSLLAVGGYGRGQVALGSDVDVVLLCDAPNEDGVSALLEAFLYPLWDTGLEVGYAVRGVKDTLELSRQDLATATTLLDTRRLAGSRALCRELSERARRQVFGAGLADFLAQLDAGRSERHKRFGASLYLLEPQVKLGCGGLRDLDTAMWAANARWGIRSRKDLVLHGYLRASEAEDFSNAEEMIWRVRNLLHLRAGRRQDRLTFEDQEEIASKLGFVDGVNLAVEQFMQAYYRHARAVEQVMERVVSQARHISVHHPLRTKNLGEGILLFDGHVTFYDSKRIEADPAMIFRLYEAAAKRNAPVYGFARDSVVSAMGRPELSPTLGADRACQDLFLSALSCTATPPLRRGSILAELHSLGVLLAMVPEFEPITGRVQHDVYHVYTVDVHSVAAVDFLCALKRGDHAQKLPLASRLAAEIPRKDSLFFGLLLHDVGKAHGKAHSEKGALMARPIAERFGFTAPEVDHIVWLVREHLSLYHWSTRRDISDPAELEAIVDEIESLDRLRDLYLLTVADLSTTNPTAMTSWKAGMLDALYRAVAHRLQAGGEAPNRAKAVRQRVLDGAPDVDAKAALEAFLARMPDRYLLANSVDAIGAHAQALRDAAGKDLAVSALSGSNRDVAELVIVTRDRAGLLATLAAGLAAQRLVITSAQVYTRDQPDGSAVAFNLFQVSRASADEAVDPDRLARLETDLRSLLNGEVEASELLSRRLRRPSWAQRHSPDVPTEIHVSNEASPRFTVIDVFTRDRPALLHVIARTLHECGLIIALSKINTEGERAADIFYVHDGQGGKVDAELAQTLKQRLTDATCDF